MDHGIGNPHIGIRHLQPVLDPNPKARPSRLPHICCCHKPLSAMQPYAMHVVS